jgi:hypothetical protein
MRVKLVVVAAVAAMALTAITASSASASIVSAKFSPSGALYVKSTGVTIKKNGESAKTCTVSNIRTEEIGTGAFLGSNEAFGGARFACSGSPGLQLAFYGGMKYDTETGRYWLQISDLSNGSHESPFGPFWQITNGADQWTWVNGSGSTPSTMTLNEVYVGYVGSTHEKITISGTFTATTLSGGLVTLTH